MQNSCDGDIVSKDQKQSWFYSDIVKDHFFNPRNFLDEELKDGEYNAFSRVGSPACGDELKIWLLIDPKTEKIKKFYWKTFGCASAIASTSVMSEMVIKDQGMDLDQALAITPQDIVKELGGLPPRKIHCSVLCDQALRAAIEDYYHRTKQSDKIKTL